MYKVIEINEDNLMDYIVDINYLELKESDKEELKGLGYSEFGYLESFYLEEHSLRMVCYYDNKLIGIIGVKEIESTIYPYFLSNSMIYSDKILKRLFIRFSVQIIKLIKDRFKDKEIITYKLTTDVKGYRWLKWLGFENTNNNKRFVKGYEFFKMKMINK